MDLKTYLDQPHISRREFSQRVGINPVYLSHIALGYRNAGECVALAIERETAGAVTIGELRPDLAEALERGGYVRPADSEDDPPPSPPPSPWPESGQGAKSDGSHAATPSGEGVSSAARSPAAAPQKGADAPASQEAV